MSRRRRNSGGGHGEGGGDERWLLTYADMITLLLALFIILFAMSTIDARKFDEVRRSLSQSFSGQVFNANKDVMDGSQSVLDPAASSGQPNNSSFDVQENARDRKRSAFARQQQTLDKLSKDAKIAGVKVSSTQRGIVVSLAGDTTFESGSAALRPEAIEFLDKLAVQLRANRSEIAIGGHTDGQPINTAQYPSNWHLSGARALSVLTELRNDGVLADHMRYEGYADTRPVQKPTGPNQAIARNRRVEIVILSAAADVREARNASSAAAAAPAASSAGTLDPVGEPVAGAASAASQSAAPIDVIGTIIDLSET